MKKKTKNALLISAAIMGLYIWLKSRSDGAIDVSEPVAEALPEGHKPGGGINGIYDNVLAFDQRRR